MFSETCYMVIDCGLESLFRQALIPNPSPHIHTALSILPPPRHDTHPSQPASHQPWHCRLALALSVLSVLQTTPHLSCYLLQGTRPPCTARWIHGYLHLSSLSHLPAVSPASSPIDPSKIEAWGKTQDWARPQLLSQSCSLPPTASPLRTDSTVPRELLRWHTICFLCSNETRGLKVWSHMRVHSNKQ